MDELIEHILILIPSAIIGLLIFFLLTLLGIISCAFTAMVAVWEGVGYGRTRTTQLPPIAAKGITATGTNTAQTAAALPPRRFGFRTQPAILSFPFERGWRVLRMIWQGTRERLEHHLRWARREIRRRDPRQNGRRLNPIITFWQWMYVSGWRVLIGLHYGAMFFLLAVVTLVTTILYSVWVVSIIVAVGVWHALYIMMDVRRLFRHCPVCYEALALPAFTCSSCGRQHTRLWPSIYGIATHRCLCGTKLPSLDLFGRRKLFRRCPSCRHPLPPLDLQGAQLHLGIVGGPSSGKTHYLIALLHHLLHSQALAARFEIHFPSQHDADLYQADWRQMTKGHLLGKSTAIAPHAQTLLLAARRRRAHRNILLYFYDPAGEVFSTGGKIEYQRYYQHVDGLILLIDPFALPLYRRQHEDEMATLAPLVQPSTSQVAITYARMLAALEQFQSPDKNMAFTCPIAVVISKTDALDLENIIGQQAAMTRTHADNVNEIDDTIHHLVRDFLLTYGQEELVLSLEARFQRVRYFSSSALGRLPNPTNTDAFVSRRISNAFFWHLNQARPRRRR